jgi:hypothetical protein
MRRPLTQYLGLLQPAAAFLPQQPAAEPLVINCRAVLRSAQRDKMSSLDAVPIDCLPIRQLCG